MTKKYFENGKRILNRLTALGYEAFFVGGFVRDYLLGIEANDIDITTNALPNEVESIFEETKATGKKYGTISVFINQQQFEVTTYRADIKYIDYRHPERVDFSKNLKDDLKRRDFTINAFAMDKNLKIIDMFSGKKDLENKLIKAIGDPDIRFNEDALRMLRAFRFVSKLDFDIEENTMNCIKKNIGLLNKISNERIISEIKQIFKYENYQSAIKLLNDANIEKAFPEISEAISLLSSKINYKINYIEFFAIAFYLYNAEIPSYWRFSNKESNMINKIVESVSKCKFEGFEKETVYTYGLEVSLSTNKIVTILGYHKNSEDKIKEIYKQLPIYSLNDLDYSGDDIIKFLKGRRNEIIGEILRKIEMKVIVGKLENNHDEIEKYVIEILEKINER